MSLSFNSLLTSLAEKYYISAGSPEAKKIEASIKHLKANLQSYFDDTVLEVIEFGSYKRDTILPKSIDQHRDVDLMVLFDHSNLRFNPSTYRKHIQEFSDFYYPNSRSFKSKPTVVLEFSHLKYDLVPAFLESGWFSKTYYIPEDDTQWLSTDPHGFNEALIKKNKNNHYLIKPLIRLLKAWNVKAGYPVNSFYLENEIVDTTFYSLNTLEEYFFDSISSLSTSYDASSTRQKINALKENADRVSQALNDEKEKQALRWLGHILPL